MGPLSPVATNGEANGLPPLHRGMRVSEWTAVFQSEYDRLVEQMRSVDTTRPGRRLEESGPPETRVVIAAFRTQV